MKNARACPRLLWLALIGTGGLGAQVLPKPPGQRPLPADAHALVNARVVPKPGVEMAKATVLLRAGRIEAVGPNVKVPPEARVHDLSGVTVYAGFIDAHVTLSPVTESRGGGSADDTLTAGAGSGFLGAPAATGEAGTPAVVTPERRMAREFKPEGKLLEDLRAEGFTAANFVPNTGVIRGASALASLSGDSPDRALIRPDVFQHVLLDTPRSESSSSRPRAYPASLMGVIAVIRQTFMDARFQAADLAHYARHPNDRPRPPQRADLDALQPALHQAQAVVFQPGGVLMVDRALRLAGELELRPVLLATGQEWRRPDLLRGMRASFIVPLDFPEAPKLPEEEDWQAVSLDLLRAWDHAPGNPALLSRRGRQIALTTHGLGKKSAFHPNLRLAVARGLNPDDALAALTTAPAALCGAADQLGAIEPGKLAHLTLIENGRLTEPGARVRAVWIDGRLFEPPPREAKPASAAAPAKPAADHASARVKTPAAAEADPRGQLSAAPARRGRGPLLSPKAVLIRNATIWTCGPAGILENASLLVTDGKITRIGNFEARPGPDTHVIDLPGIHVTPGLIDCHSHSMILGGVNEGTLPSTAMVRIADVVNSETDTIAQQLAGGLTIANLLHGSANPIGGQNCVIKLRDGAPPGDLKIPDAKPGIKFALGENVKQSNWGDNFRSRFPQSRMGVPAFHTNRFTAARQYLQALEQVKPGGPPIRRDLELEAIGEILRGERLIHCHSYRQDEILAFLRVMEGFGVRVGTLQHILEGYKVADEIAKHGAGASAFSDWWAYKFEVFDAIPHAGSLMHERGVLVSFNSDSSDHARRMNLEAAKAVKYGGTSEEEALKFVTLNPAKQLAIDHRAGSLETGKDGDFVVWSGHPLAASTICLQTWIEGRQFFERQAARRRAQARERERLALIDKAKKAGGGGGEPADTKAVEKFFWRALEDRQGHLCVDCCLDLELPWKN